MKAVISLAVSGWDDWTTYFEIRCLKAGCDSTHSLDLTNSLTFEPRSQSCALIRLLPPEYRCESAHTELVVQ